jgi:hypothetical protein
MYFIKSFIKRNRKVWYYFRLLYIIVAFIIMFVLFFHALDSEREFRVFVANAIMLIALKVWFIPTPFRSTWRDEQRERALHEHIDNQARTIEELKKRVEQLKSDPLI